MKLELRKMAQAGGQRAVALGLGADDLVKIEEYIEQLKQERDSKKKASSKLLSKVHSDELQMKVLYSQVLVLPTCSSSICAV